MIVLFIGVLMGIGWVYNILTSMGRHSRRLPAILHVLWILMAAVFIFVGVGEVSHG
jgi:hypothetical protein